MMSDMKTVMEVLTRRRIERRRRGEASWLVVLPMFLLFMSALVAARSMPAWGALLVFAGALAAVAVAGLLWGADSRDGSDWAPRKPGAIR
jgi:hypothetical protein